MKPKQLAHIALGLFGAMFGIMALANHYFFRSTAFDFGPYNYAFYDYAHGHLTPCPIYKVFFPMNVNFLQDHFSLLLMFLVPFYWLLNWLSGTYTLLILQTLFIVWAAWAIYKLVELKTGDAWLAFGAVIYYFLLQGRYAAFEEECNIIIMASCFVPVFLWYFESKRYTAACVVFILAVFSREDMSLWFVFIALVVMIWHRREKKIVYTSIAYVLAAVLVFILIQAAFIPMVASPDRKYDLFTYSALGNGPLEALEFIFKNPLDALSMLFKNHTHDAQYDSVKMEFYMVYLVSGGFVLFYRPQYFIWFIPLIAQKMFNDEPVRWSIESYYCVQVATLLPIPVFIILANEKQKLWRYLLAVIVCSLTLTVTMYESNPLNRKLGYRISGKSNIFDSTFFSPSYNTSQMHKDLKLIPADAPVSASTSVLPHLAQRKGIYEFPDVEDAQYLAVFTSHDYYVMPSYEYVRALFSKYVFNPDWQIIAYDRPLIVLKKGKGASTGISCDSIVCDAETMAPDYKHLSGTGGVQFEIDSKTWNNEHVHSGLRSVKLTKETPFGMTLHMNNFKEGDFIFVSVWRYSGDKDKGALVLSAGKSLYMPTSVSVEKDSAGWEKLVIFSTVPAEHPDMGVYVWNTGDSPVWFDDMVVKRLTSNK